MARIPELCQWESAELYGSDRRVMASSGVRGGGKYLGRELGLLECHSPRAATSFTS